MVCVDTVNLAAAFKPRCTAWLWSYRGYYRIRTNVIKQYFQRGGYTPVQKVPSLDEPLCAPIEIAGLIPILEEYYLEKAYLFL